jgi:hypothetical protein
MNMRIFVADGAGFLAPHLCRKLLDIQEPRIGIEPEIKANLGAMRLRIFEVPISPNGRRTYDDRKKITWKDGFNEIRCIFKCNTAKQKKKQYGKLSL